MKMEKNILVRYENFNRFGFDRVKFKNIRVIKYDIDTLKDCHHKSYGVAKIRYNSKNLKSLRIERRGIGRLEISREKYYNIDWGLYARIDFSPTDILGQNIENFSLEELKKAVWEIKEILYEDYKIEIDISNVIFSYCEINYNYLTTDNTKDFEDPLRTLVRFIPYMKICIDIENHKEKEGYESKTITVQNQRHKITFYDKSKETEKKHKNKKIVIVDENGEILNGRIYRYEHTIKKTDKFKNVFEETNLFNLNEEVFYQKLFLYLEKNLFKPYEKQKLMCRDLLVKAVKKYREKDRRGKEWGSLMISDILIQERQLGYQILFDSEDLLEIVSEVFLKDKNKGRILGYIKRLLCKEPYLYYSKNKKEKVENLVDSIKSQFQDLIK
ncbi:MAG: hypothetical protein E6Z20_05390 [Finegoldia magna]|nr:hypothetical protein [Finegoldia magna]